MLNWADYGIEICGTAMNGQDAFEMIAEYSPEIVITDIRMPTMNGLTLQRPAGKPMERSPCLSFLQATKNSSSSRKQWPMSRGLFNQAGIKCKGPGGGS